MPELSLFVICGLAAGMYMAWTIGANDVANAMGTSVGSKALTLGMAILVAAVFEFSGAFFAGSHVADTIKQNVVNLGAFARKPHAIAIGMLSALVAAAAWLHIATWRGWPVSTTHSIVGAVAGFGLFVGGIGAVRWSVIGQIVASWLISPLLGGLMAWVLFSIVRRLVFKARHPVLRARIVTPVIVASVAFVLTLSMTYKGLKNLSLSLPIGQALGCSLLVGLVAYLVGVVLFRRWEMPLGSFETEVRVVERQFRYLQIVTACYVAFAHGSNDAANAVGPMAAVLNSAQNLPLAAKVEIPAWVMALGGFGIVLGLATYGYKVIYTIGSKITELTPSRGFAMEFATASIVLLGSKLGLPVSTTHILIGAVIGVGVARGMAALNTRVIIQIVWSWIITVPVAALLSAGIYAVLIHVL